MDISEISGDSPGTSKVYQIDGKDLVDIGGTANLRRFNPKKVDKIALTCPWTEHSQNLDLIDKQNNSDISKIEQPTIYCSDPEELIHGKSLEIKKIEDGDIIELSGYEFRVIVIPLDFNEAMLYNKKERILFSGDITNLSKLPQKNQGEVTNRLKKLRKLKIKEEFPAIGDNTDVKKHIKRLLDA